MYQTRKSYNYEIFLVCCIAIYIFLGKLSIFYALHISTDYLFWLVIAVCAVGVALLRDYMSWNQRIIPLIIYLGYMFVEMLRAEYAYYACVTFCFNVLVIGIFWLLIGKKGAATGGMRLLYWGGGYFAVTVILQFLFPNVINTFRKYLLLDMDYEISQMGYENTRNYLSGFATTSAIASFFIAVFVAVAVAKVLTGKKQIKNLIVVIMGVIALFLTKKRTIFLGTIFAIIFIYVMFKKDSNRKKICFMFMGILGGIFTCLALLFISDISGVLKSLLGSLESLVIRQEMYDIMLQWFHENRLLGAGIGTAMGTWGYGGHNCYLQILGESGIIGCIVFAGVIGPYIYKSAKLLYFFWNDEETLNKNSYVPEVLVASNIVLVMILIYALTGNPFYDYTFYLTFFMMLAIPTEFQKENGI